MLLPRRRHPRREARTRRKKRRRTRRMRTTTSPRTKRRSSRNVSKVYNLQCHPSASLFSPGSSCRVFRLQAPTHAEPTWHRSKYCRNSRGIL